MSQEDPVDWELSQYLIGNDCDLQPGEGSIGSFTRPANSLVDTITSIDFSPNGDWLAVCDKAGHVAVFKQNLQVGDKGQTSPHSPRARK